MLCGGRASPFGAFHLPLADHMHDFNARKDDARAPEIIEAHHRPDDAFDGAVVLLGNIVQVLALPDRDRRFPPNIDRLKGRQIRAAFIYRDSL